MVQGGYLRKLSRMFVDSKRTNKKGNMHDKVWLFCIARLQ